MLDKGRKVRMGKLAATVMEAGKPAAPASGDATGAPTVPPSDAQLIALAKKTKEKKAEKRKKDKKKRKLANSLLAQHNLVSGATPLATPHTYFGPTPPLQCQ